MFWGVKLWCGVVNHWQFASEWAASLMHAAHLDAKRKKADDVPGLFGNSGGLGQALLLLQCVLLLLGSLRGLERVKTHIHTHRVCRDWWWCTASVCWGASSAVHNARRVLWLRLTQRERRAKETTICSQRTTTPPQPETVALSSFWSPVSKDSLAPLLMVMLFVV